MIYRYNNTYNYESIIYKNYKKINEKAPNGSYYKIYTSTNNQSQIINY